MKALQGIRILDLTHMLSGPYAGMLLADLGADSIKVEPPVTGERTRRLLERDPQNSLNGFGAYYMTLNRNKKSITLDLKSEKGLALFYELVKTADVVLSNFSAGVTERLKIDYAQLSKINPRILTCTVTGFGETGPAKHHTAFDMVAQALGGGMSITGQPGDPPVNLTNHAGDDQQPAWSPDGNWIVFTSNRDGNQEIYIMRSDGSEVRNLTANAASDFAPTWFSVPRFLGLSTEDWIAFTTTRDGNQEIYRVRPDGAGLTNLTNNSANDYAPAGFAGGTLLAFVTDRNGNAEVYTMTSGGGTPANVTNNPAQDLDPAFDPSGRWVAFSSDRDGNLEIYVVYLPDGRIYNLTLNPSQDQYPDW